MTKHCVEFFYFLNCADFFYFVAQAKQIYTSLYTCCICRAAAVRTALRAVGRRRPIADGRSLNVRYIALKISQTIASDR